MPNWLIYGANGYTGELIAREASERGLQPILAGRTAEKIESLATELNLPWRTFDLTDRDALAEHLADCTLVLNCAGPFIDTAPAMIDACLQAGANYLDITGEIDVLELAAARHQQAVTRGVTLLPAVGFDVVPTDCLAKMLAERLPAATHLELAFTMMLKTSPGTTKTIARTLPGGGRVRENGVIRRVPVAWKTREVPFSGGQQLCVSIPWGDVATAWHSTGIPNIIVFTAMPAKRIRGLRWLRPLLPLAHWSVIRHWISRTIERKVKGPSAAQRRKGKASLWGRVAGPGGEEVTATLETPEGYALTILSALAAVEKVLAAAPPPGFTTPSGAFGADFVLSLPGVRREFRDADSNR